MNVIDFALRMRDYASGPLRNFGAAANQAFSRANSAMGGLGQRNQALGSSFAELQNRMRQVEATIRNSTIPSQIAEARRELAALQRQAASHPGGDGGRIGGGRMGGGGGGLGVMGVAMGGMIASGIMSGATAAVGFLQDSVQAAFDRQKVQTSFNVLAGSQQAGELVTKQLVDLQKNTILGAEVFKQAQTLMGFGFKSTEVADNLRMLGDVAMGDKEKLGSLTLAFAQVRAGGKLTGQDMLQFINAGFNPMQQMAETTGKSMAALKKEMEQGKISYQMVADAFKNATSEGGRYNNMLAKIAETPAGKMAQLSGAWDEFKVKAGNAFMPLITGALTLANKLMPIIDNFMTPLGQAISNIVNGFNNATTATSGFMSYLQTIKTLFVEHIFPVISKIWGLIKDIAASIYDAVDSSELLKDVFSLLGTIFGGMWDALGLIVDGIKWIWDKLKPVFEQIEIAYRMYKSLFTGEKMKLEVNSKGELILPKEEKKAKDKESADKKSADDKMATLLAENAKIAQSNSASAAAAESTISGGGPKVLNITIGKFFDNINIHPATMEQGVADIERKVSEMFSRVLIQGATAK
jgi:tape measure domain-containing protein